AYRDARRALVDEFGLEPGEGLRDLERAIIRRDPALLVRPPEPEAPPAAPTQPARRPLRKTVTVLVASPAQWPGQTGHDPETLRGARTRFAAATAPVLQGYGATVETLGDDVTAFFGVPVVHEDDSLRAVRAAVELRDVLEGVGVRARIALATGEVLVE